jgi:carbonic anhydrase
MRDRPFPPQTEDPIVTVTDELLAHNAEYVASFDQGDLPLAPAKKLAVVACMDARLNPYAVLGLKDGDAHVIRNAGGVVTDDVIRSLAVTQRLAGTEEIIVIHHTDCAMHKVTDAEFKAGLQDVLGVEPTWTAETTGHPDADLRDAIACITASPFIPHTEHVRGFIYDVKTGALREVA